MSFNGGKDCTVLLHILNRVYNIKFGSEAPPLLCLYVRTEDPFPEVLFYFITYNCINLYIRYTFVYVINLKTIRNAILSMSCYFRS